jgi:tripartite-type tricarboxylate transporter receptor subunit TctC
VVKALADPELRERYAAVGLRSRGSTPEEVTAVVREQLARYGKAIRDNNIKGD